MPRDQRALHWRHDLVVGEALVAVDDGQHVSGADTVAEPPRQLADDAGEAWPHLDDAVGVQPDLARGLDPHLDRPWPRQLGLDASRGDRIGRELDPALELLVGPGVPLPVAVQVDARDERVRLVHGAEALPGSRLGAEAQAVTAPPEAVERHREHGSGGVDHPAAIVGEVGAELRRRPFLVDAELEPEAFRLEHPPAVRPACDVRIRARGIVPVPGRRGRAGAARGEGQDRERESRAARVPPAWRPPARRGRPDGRAHRTSPASKPVRAGGGVSQRSSSSRARHASAVSSSSRSRASSTPRCPDWTSW